MIAATQLGGLLGMLALAAASGTAIRTSGPEFAANRGVDQYQLESPYTSGKNLLEVLLSDSLANAPAEQECRYRVMYVLPVEAGTSRRYGDSMQLLRRLDGHNQYGLIIVAPTFDTAPWYGSHATNSRIRHDQYLIKTVIPLVDQRYPTVATAEGRLLLGFSKSGWGAFALIARNPQVFGYAASWDAPLMMDVDNFGLYGTRQHFGDPQQFARYLPPRVLVGNAKAFRPRPRMVLAGWNFFGRMGRPPSCKPEDGFCHTAKMHTLMNELGIPHLYNRELHCQHFWNADWVGPTLKMLMSLTEGATP